MNDAVKFGIEWHINLMNQIEKPTYEIGTQGNTHVMGCNGLVLRFGRQSQSYIDQLTQMYNECNEENKIRTEDELKELVKQNLLRHTIAISNLPTELKKYQDTNQIQNYTTIRSLKH